MLIRYSKPDQSFPPLIRAKPTISEHEQRLKRAPRPPAVPSHCRPWIDANSYGLILLFPYMASVSVEGREGDVPIVEIDSGPKRLRYRDIISNFSRTHFGLATQYCLLTEPGIGLFISRVPDGYPSPAEPVRGLIETWWYPKPLFLVFEAPLPSQRITFRYGDPLCTLMPVLCETATTREMTPAEAEQFRINRQQYEEYLAHHPDLRWTSAEGEGFSRQYKLYANLNRARPNRPSGDG